MTEYRLNSRGNRIPVSMRFQAQALAKQGVNPNEIAKRLGIRLGLARGYAYEANAQMRAEGLPDPRANVTVADILSRPFVLGFSPAALGLTTIAERDALEAYLVNQCIPAFLKSRGNAA